MWTCLGEDRCTPPRVICFSAQHPLVQCEAPAKSAAMQSGDSFERFSGRVLKVLYRCTADVQSVTMRITHHVVAACARLHLWDVIPYICADPLVFHPPLHEHAAARVDSRCINVSVLQ